MSLLTLAGSMIKIIAIIYLKQVNRYNIIPEKKGADHYT